MFALVSFPFRSCLLWNGFFLSFIPILFPLFPYFAYWNSLAEIKWFPFRMKGEGKNKESRSFKDLHKFSFLFLSEMTILFARFSRMWCPKKRAKKNVEKWIQVSFDMKIPEHLSTLNWICNVFMCVFEFLFHLCHSHTFPAILKRLSVKTFWHFHSDLVERVWSPNASNGVQSSVWDYLCIKSIKWKSLASSKAETQRLLERLATKEH